MHRLIIYTLSFLFFCSETVVLAEAGSVPEEETIEKNESLESDDGQKGFGLQGGGKAKKRGRKRRKGRKKRQRQKRQTAKDTPVPAAKPQKTSYMGIGAQAGWEAPYGNGATLHFIIGNFLDLNGGVGYNNSGLKIGGGAHILLNMSDSFALRLGASLINSQGRSGDVSLEASFTPENSGSSETIEASKDFEVSSALIASPSIGIKLALNDAFSIVGGGNYNVILSGNEVTFKDDISFNKNIELTNETDFDEQFQEEAKDLVQAGGLGFYAGILISL